MKGGADAACPAHLTDGWEDESKDEHSQTVSWAKYLVAVLIAPGKQTQRGQLVWQVFTEFQLCYVLRR